MLMRKFAVALMGCFFLLGFSMAHADKAPVKKKWTFMIFLNGNNNLDDYGEANIKAMEKVGSNDDVNIVVQWASMSKQKVTRLYIQKSSDSSQVTSPVIEDLGHVDMGNPESLEAFIKWTVKNYPADHYFIDVWNHGGGWERKRLAGVTNKDISWDELTGNSISTEQLGHVMARASRLIGHKVDIYGSDACLMGMAEVANEMSDSVKYFVGSQELEPAQGWPYATFLARWEASSNATAVDITRMLTDEYVKAYSPGGVYPRRDVTFSAFDLRKLPELNEKMRTLGVTMRNAGPAARQAILTNAKKAQTFGYLDYADLIDVLSLLSNSTHQQSLQQEELDSAIAAAKAMIIANKGTSRYARATGLSVWMPVSNETFERRAERYKHLRFGMNSEWSKTLESLLQGAHQQQPTPDDDQTQPAQPTQPTQPQPSDRV